jgi:hypothetical protein
MNDKKSATGLGGFTLSGEPGIGKSEFIQVILKANGYQEYDKSKENDPKTTFITLSAYDHESKKEMLEKAYQKGYIVIIDELNTPLNENLLNDFVGTKRADSQGSSPGFMVFGTQNPASMPGRQATSSATQHRFLPIELSSYPENELSSIELKKSHTLNEEQIKAIIEDFIELNEELINDLKKAPHSYRFLQDRLKIGDEIVLKLKELNNYSEKIAEVYSISRQLIKEQIKNTDLEELKQATDLLLKKLKEDTDPKRSNLNHNSACWIEKWIDAKEIADEKRPTENIIQPVF